MSELEPSELEPYIYDSSICGRYINTSPCFRQGPNVTHEKLICISESFTYSFTYSFILVRVIHILIHILIHTRAYVWHEIQIDIYMYSCDATFVTRHSYISVSDSHV